MFRIKYSNFNFILIGPQSVSQKASVPLTKIEQGCLVMQNKSTELDHYQGFVD